LTPAICESTIVIRSHTGSDSEPNKGQACEIHQWLIKKPWPVTKTSVGSCLRLRAGLPTSRQHALLRSHAATLFAQITLRLGSPCTRALFALDVVCKRSQQISCGPLPRYGVPQQHHGGLGESFTASSDCSNSQPCELHRFGLTCEFTLPMAVLCTVVTYLATPFAAPNVSD